MAARKPGRSYSPMPGGARGKCGAPGFTLVEVMLAFAILAMVLVALISTCFGVVGMNKKIELHVNAMSLVNEQLSEVLAASGSVPALEEVDNSPAKAFLWDMRAKMDHLAGSPSDFPYSVTLDPLAGVLIYQFMIPVPGRPRLDMTSPVADILDPANRNRLARGVVVAYLRENAVPRQFYAYADSNAGGAKTPWPYNWFPMAGTGSDGTADYAGLLTAADPDWKGSTLQNLPVAVSVRYYDTEAEMNADVLAPTTNDVLDYGAAAIGASRVCLVTSNQFSL